MVLFLILNVLYNKLTDLHQLCFYFYKWDFCNHLYIVGYRDRDACIVSVCFFNVAFLMVLTLVGVSGATYTLPDKLPQHRTPPGGSFEGSHLGKKKLSIDQNKNMSIFTRFCS